MISCFKKPLITYMLPCYHGEKIPQEAAKAIENGADAVGLQLEMIPPELINPGFISEVIAAADGRPVYVTDYRRNNRTPSKTDDMLANELISALELGASIIDVPAHMFSDSKTEISFDSCSIKKQRELIDEIHKRGSVALMSSHMFRFMKRDEVYELASAHESRGADISKIVTSADSESELTENLIIAAELKNKINIPYLFLCNGKYCACHRMLSAVLGSCMMLTSTDEQPKNPQPNLNMAIELLDLINCHRANLNEIK